MTPLLFITVVSVGAVSATMTACAGGMLVFRSRYRNRMPHRWTMPRRSRDADTQRRIAGFLKDLQIQDR